MPSFSLAKRIKNPYEFTTARKVPGVGKYNFVPAINGMGRYYNSKHGSSLS